MLLTLLKYLTLLLQETSKRKSLRIKKSHRFPGGFFYGFQATSVLLGEQWGCPRDL
jgi:hypothetical protein